jgi:hypothetical protein
MLQKPWREKGGGEGGRSHIRGKEQTRVVMVFVAEGRIVANEGGGVDDDQNGREKKRSESRENGGSNTGPE